MSIHPFFLLLLQLSIVTKAGKLQNLSSLIYIAHTVIVRDENLQIPFWNNNWNF